MAEREPDQGPDPALAKFAVLQLVRLVCIGVVLSGAALYVGRIGDDPLLGGALLVAGVAGFFLLPRLLARRWKSSDA